MAFSRKDDGAHTSATGAVRLRQAERRRTELRAISLDELIGEEHPARLV
jgi:hypothetical protein